MIPQNLLNNDPTLEQLRIEQERVLKEVEAETQTSAKRIVRKCDKNQNINPFISISTFTRHIGEMVFGRRSGFWLGYFATAALTSGPCF